MNNDNLISNLISRKGLRKAFYERMYYFNKLSWYVDEDEAITLNDKVKKVLSERPTGEWLLLNFDDGNNNHKWSCNNCGRGVKEQENFCPNCGLKMKRDKKLKGA